MASPHRSAPLIFALLVAAAPASAQFALPCSVPSALRVDKARYAEATKRLASLMEQRGSLLGGVAPPASREDYDVRRAEHKAQLLAALDAASVAFERRVEVTRTLLAQIPSGNPLWTRDMEEWMRLGSTERERERDNAFFAAFEFTLERAQLAAGLEPQLGEHELGMLGDWLDKYGQNAMTQGAVRVVRGRLKGAHTQADVMEALEYMRAQHARYYRLEHAFKDKDKPEKDKAEKGDKGEKDEQQPDKRELWENATLGLLALVAKVSSIDPSVAAASRTARLWADADDYYGWASLPATQGRLAELAALPEQSYDELMQLSRDYIDNTRKLRELRRARNLLAQLVC